MTDIVIRGARLADVQTLAAFNTAMARETEDKALDPDVIVAGVTALVSKPDLGFFLVAESGGEVAGCLAVTYEWSDWRNGLFWWIQSVYVHPDHRRRGVFRRLYRHVIERARESASVCGVRLYVERENTTAQATYKRLGMEETSYRLFEVEFEGR